MQFDFGTIDPTSKSGAALASDLNNWRNATHSGHKGAAAPTYIQPGMVWVKEVSGSLWQIMLRGSAGSDVVLGDIDPALAAWDIAVRGGTFTAIPQLPAVDPDTANDAVRKAYVDTKDGLALPKAGGTMTGLLTLSGAPTGGLHAATKTYVDERTAANKNAAAVGSWSGAYDLLGSDTTFFDVMLSADTASIIGAGSVSGYTNGGTDVVGTFVVQVLDASLAAWATTALCYVSTASTHSPSGTLYWQNGGGFAFAGLPAANSGWRLRFVASKAQPQPMLLTNYRAQALCILR